MSNTCGECSVLFLHSILTLAHIGRVENEVLCVCVCEQNFWTTNNSGTLSYINQQALNYKIQDRLFLKPFCCKVTCMTILQLMVAISPFSEEL